MPEREGFPKTIYRALASMRLTVFVFFTLAAASIIGTLFPQGMTGDEVQHAFSPALAKIINALGLHDLYRTGWFQFLLLLLCVNLIVCTFQRFPKTLKLMRHREGSLSSDKLKKFSQSSQISTKFDMEEARTMVESVFAKHFQPLKQLNDSIPYGAQAERGKWSHFMVYIIHLSVLVVLIGALMGSVFGFKGTMNVLEGETEFTVSLARGDSAVDLPFSVRCDDFSVSYYDTGAPKEFKSDLTILEDGKEILKRSIRVNDPLTHKGVTLYQSSYGSMLKDLDLELTDTNSGTMIPMQLKLREPALIPGTSTRLQVMDYREDLRRLGPAVAIVVLREGQEPTGSWILANMPKFHGNRIENYQITVKKAVPVQYTGLQVKEDPGVWVVWTGFAAMLLGIALTYYTSHQRIWVLIEPRKGDRENAKVTVAGRANRNPVAFEEEFQELCRALQAELTPSTKDLKK